MIRAVTFLYIILLLVACNSRRLPSDILPQEKMQAVMWDVIRSGEFLNGYVFSKDTSLNQAATSQVWFNKIFQLHQVTKEQFEKSYEYYKQHPKVMQELLDSLSKRSDSVDSLARAKRDSLKHIPVDTTKARLVDTMRKKKILRDVEPR